MRGAMGNVFLIAKHFSLSMNKLLFLMDRSCSKAALVRSRAWRAFSASRSLCWRLSTVLVISPTSSTSLLEKDKNGYDLWTCIHYTSWSFSRFRRRLICKLIIDINYWSNFWSIKKSIFWLFLSICNKPVLNRIPAKFNIWSPETSIKTGLGHLHGSFFVLDSFLEELNVLFHVIDLLQNLNGEHKFSFSLKFKNLIQFLKTKKHSKHRV